MCKALIIEHGRQGSGGYITAAIMEIQPGSKVIQTDPNNADKLIESERWDLVVVDEGRDRAQAISDTSNLPNFLTLYNGRPVVFVTADPELRGVILFEKPWIFSTRDEIGHAIKSVLHPDHRKALEDSQGICEPLS